MIAVEYEVPVRRELEPGEQLLWSGQPRRGVAFGPKDLPAFIFSLFWCGLAIFWETSVTLTVVHHRSKMGWFGVLCGIPFVAPGLYIAAGRFVVDTFQRART